MTGPRNHRQAAQNAQGGDPSAILCQRLAQQARALWRFLLRNNADPVNVRSTRVDRPGVTRHASSPGGVSAPHQTGANPTADQVNSNLISLLMWAHGR